MDMDISKYISHIRSIKMDVIIRPEHAEINRAVLLKRFARSLAETKGMLDEFELFERVERLTPEVLRSVKGEEKVVCANVDLFSGLVYKMMGIPMELYTPLFAVARMVGWCAHRIEEVCQPANRIIRPAYKAVAPMRAFVPLDQR